MKAKIKNTKMGKGGGIGEFLSSAKKQAKRGADAAKKGYAKAEKYTKNKIHDQKKKIALDVLSETAKRAGVTKKEEEFIINPAYDMVYEKFDKGGEVLAVTNEIARQIGKKALYMLGARELLGDSNSISFKIRGSSKWKKIKIKLTAKDLYDITFYTWKKMDFQSLKSKEIKDVYAQDLHRIIEKETGLYTSLEKGGEVDEAKNMLWKYFHDIFIKIDTAGSNEYWCEIQPSLRINEAEEILEKMENTEVVPGIIIKSIFENLGRDADESNRRGNDTLRVKSNLDKFKKGELYDKGGEIPNNYKGKTAEQIWDAWNPDQKKHFIVDHEVLKPFMKPENDIINKKWNQLPEDVDGIYIKGVISNHINSGQYEHGGEISSLPSAYFKTMNLSALPAEAAEHIKNNILTNNNIDLFARTEDFVSTKNIIAETFPDAFPQPKAAEPTIDDYTTMLESAKIQIEFTEGDEKKKLQDFIGALKLTIAAMKENTPIKVNKKIKQSKKNIKLTDSAHDHRNKTKNRGT